MIVPSTQLMPPAAAPAQGIAVALPAPPVPVAGEPEADGSVTVDLDPQAAAFPGLDALGHDDDLSRVLDAGVLAQIAADCIEGFDADWESNRECRDTLTEGLKLLGLKPGERMSMPFPNATAVRDPMLLEAAVRFYATASAELFPADGPARTQVIGDGGNEAEAIAERKKEWLNFYLTKKDRGYLPDARQGLFLTGLYGSTFKKVFRDPRRGRPAARTLTVWDLVVSANTASLEDADRITQIERVSQPEMRRLQLAGYYRDIPLSEPTESDEESDRPGDRTDSERPEDEAHEVLHQYVLLDIEGLEHATEAGEATGLPLPYIVSVERESQTVLRLVRNYDQDDALFLPRDGFVHYQYLPGLEFYGLGLIHLMGQSADAATTMLRQAINAFTLYSFPGGFKKKGLKAEKANDPIGPGQFKEIDTGDQPIQAAIMAMPYRDVPGSFQALREAIVTAGQRMGSTADVAVGDGREDAPVGTTIALIEKATKVESSVVKGLHAAMAEELRLLADLFGRETDAKYPYLVNGQRGQALAADFANNDDIVPVSDPNAPTQTQRLALAQGELQLAMQAGPLMDKRVAYENMLRAIGRNDQEIQRLMPPPQQAVSADPVTELQAVLSGAPVKARPDQDHDAHIAVHQSQLAMPGIDKTPVAAMLAAHVAEHIGLSYRAKMGLAAGHPMPDGPLPPQVEAQVTQMVAQFAQQVAASMPAAVQAKPDMGPTEARLKELEILTKQASEDRKALQAEKSDNIQVARMQVQTQDQEAARQQKQRDNATAVSTALLAYLKQAAQGKADIAKTAVEGTASILAEAQQQAGQATQDRHNAGMALLDAITKQADHEHATAQTATEQKHEAKMTAADHAEAARQRKHETRSPTP